MTTIIRSAIGSVASVGFLKFLHENNIRIIGTDLSPVSAAVEFVDDFFEVPKAEKEEEVVGRYSEIIQSTKASWIISGPENEIAVLSNYKDRFRKDNCEVFHSDKEVLDRITDKWESHRLLSGVVSMPFTIEASSISSDAPDKFILKPKKGRGSSGILVGKSKKELDLHLPTISASNYILQEYISGEEYTVDTLHDLQGRLLNTVIRKRLRVDSGISIVGETVREEKLFEAIAKISGTIRFKGASCFQFIEQNGNFYLTDINPRFGGGSILSIRACATFQKNLLHLLKGEADELITDSRDYQVMKMYRYYEDIFRA